MGNTYEAMSMPIINATTKQTATVIFLHGLGDTGNGWSQMFGSIRLPYVKYICPTAKSIPVTLNGGMRMPSWFDIIGLNPGANEDEPGIEEAADLLQSYIDEEVKQGIARNRILVGGFSQGGAVALYSAFTKAQSPLAGIVALSTWLPMHQKFPACVLSNKGTPILQCHGQDDPLVSFKFGQMTSTMIKSFNQNIDFKIYLGLGHSSCETEMSDVKEFIEKCLPQI